MGLVSSYGLNTHDLRAVPNQAGPVNSIRIIRYRSEIDGLRALAVTLVILVHAFPEYLRNGYIGVDIFFVISGFLITGILLSQLESGSFSLREFYIRRANRIFPALVVMLIACLGFGWLSLYASEYKLLGRSIASGAGFAANINFFLEGGYWDISGALKPLLHLWSLGVEEQFYLLWPILLWTAWTYRFNIATVLVVIIGLSLGWNLRSTPIDQAGAFYLPFSRFWELLAGGALAYIVIVPIPERLCPLMKLSSLAPQSLYRDIRFITFPLLCNACAFLGLALIVTALCNVYPPEQFPGWHAILPVVGTVLIIGAGSGAWLNAKVFSHPLVVYVGLISYPLYIWHWPLLTFGRIIENGEISVPTRNLALLLTAVLAVATYHLVEKPLRLNPRWRSATALAFTLLLGLCGAAGYSIYARDGVETRYANPSTLAMVEHPQTVASTSKVALIGDSQAGLFAATLPIPPGQVEFFATPGWPYLAGTEYRPDNPIQASLKGTPALTTQTLDRIVSDPTIDTVIISEMYAMYMDQELLRSLPPAPPAETSAMAYEAGLRRTVKLLTEAAKRVIYVKSIPFLRNIVSMTACSAAVLPIPRKQPNNCLTPVAEVQKQREAYDKAVRRAFDGLQGVSVFDPFPYLCDERFCYVVKDGVVMYQNTSHLSNAGAYLVGIELIKYINSQQATTSTERTDARH